MRAVDGWKKGTLGDLCSIEIGGTPSRNNPDFWDSGKETSNHWVSIKDLNRRVVSDTAERITDIGARHSNVKLQKAGTVLLSFKLSIGRVAFAENDLYTNEAIAGLRSDTLNPEFLYYGLQQWDLLQSVDQAIKGATLNKEKLKQIEFEYPASKNEQTQIATILSTLDRAIEQTEAIIAKQQRIKAGLMQDLLTKGIDEHGVIRSETTHQFKDSQLGRIPVEWEVSLLDVLAERGSGHTPSKRRPDYWDGGVKWISLSDSSTLDCVHIRETEKEISELGLKNSSAVLHPVGTVVLSRDAGVGKSAVMECEMAVSQHFMAWRCGKRLYNYYLYYWLQRDKPKFEGIASGSTIVTIGLQFFKNYYIAHPLGTDEQIKIAKILLASDENVFRLKDVLEKLRHMRTGLMHDLLTGTVRVKA